ncbi:MAG: NfeD family protein [Hungatella sp.]|jgi:membrane protein implicated in regulation of membrane protease activity|nr:NfeD family protein [Hungatella sp.]
MTSVYWLVFFLILIGIEAASMALTTIWFAGGALAAFILSLFGVGVEAQLVVFVVVSFLLLFFTRPWAMRYVEKNRTKTNVEGLVGKEARITQEVNNRMNTGTALLNGQEWSARAQNDDQVYPPDCLVTVREIRGVKLIVSQNKEEI